MDYLKAKREANRSKSLWKVMQSIRVKERKCFERTGMLEVFWEISLEGFFCSKKHTLDDYKRLKMPYEVLIEGKLWIT